MRMFPLSDKSMKFAMPHAGLAWSWTKLGPMEQLQAVGGKRSSKNNNNQYQQDQNSIKVVRAMSQDKLARILVAQLQKLCQQLGLEYEAPRGNAARLLKRHITELNVSQQAKEGEHPLDGNRLMKHTLLCKL